MKLALITDQHFGVKNDSQIFLDFQKKFYDEVFIPYLIKNKITDVIDLGDTFDRRKYINFNTLSAVKEFYYEHLRRLGITVHIIVGNHSTYYKNTNDVNSPDLILREYDNIITYSNPQTVSFGGCDILMMPWINQENALQCFDAMKYSPAQIMMGHFELYEQALRRNFKFHEGIKLDDIKKYDHVYSGHYHQRITKGNFTYLGTPYEMYWDDCGVAKGFHVFDTTKRDVKFMKNPNSIYTKIYWNDTDETVDANVLLNHVKEHPEEFSNKFIKIIVKQKKNPYILDRYIDAIEQCNPHNVTIEDIIHHIESEEGDIEQIEDTLTYLKKYVNSMEDFSNKENLLNFIEELYIEAINLEE